MNCLFVTVDIRIRYLFCLNSEPASALSAFGLTTHCDFMLFMCCLKVIDVLHVIPSILDLYVCGKGWLFMWSV